MKLTLSVRYAMLLVTSDAEKRAPIGRMFRYHLSRVISTCARPSSSVE